MRNALKKLALWVLAVLSALAAAGFGESSVGNGSVVEFMCAMVLLVIAIGAVIFAKAPPKVIERD